MPTGMMMRKSKGRLLLKPLYNKHAILGRLETAINVRPLVVLRQALVEMRDLNQKLEDIAAKAPHGVVAPGSTDYAHLRNDWFGPNGMWPFPPSGTEAAVRTGLITLLHEVTNQVGTRPTVGVHWVAVPNAQFVYTTIARDHNELDLFIVTPPPPSP
jgi:hypothetical protein